MLLFGVENPIQIGVIFVPNLRKLLPLGSRIERGVVFDGLHIVHVSINQRFDFGGLLISESNVLAQARQLSSFDRFGINDSLSWRRDW